MGDDGRGNSNVSIQSWVIKRAVAYVLLFLLIGLALSFSARGFIECTLAISLEVCCLIGVLRALASSLYVAVPLRGRVLTLFTFRRVKREVKRYEEEARDRW